MAAVANTGHICRTANYLANEPRFCAERDSARLSAPVGAFSLFLKQVRLLRALGMRAPRARQLKRPSFAPVSMLQSFARPCHRATFKSANARSSARARAMRDWEGGEKKRVTAGRGEPACSKIQFPVGRNIALQRDAARRGKFRPRAVLVYSFKKHRDVSEP